MNLIPSETDIKKIESIKGHLSRSEGLVLYNFARTLIGDAIIVEIGSFKGRSTAWFATGVRDGGASAHITAVDHGIGDPEAGIEQTKDVLVGNLERLELSRFVSYIFKKSEEALSEWNSPIDILFIDAAHDFINVRKDFGYEKFLVDGGWIIFHDVLNPAEGPARVFREQILTSPHFDSFGGADSILFARKLKSANRHTHIFQRRILRFLLGLWLFCTRKYSASRKRSFNKRVLRSVMKRILRPIILSVANNF